MPADAHARFGAERVTIRGSDEFEIRLRAL
jgi:hypothetical protein